METFAVMRTFNQTRSLHFWLLICTKRDNEVIIIKILIMLHYLMNLK